MFAIELENRTFPGDREDHCYLANAMCKFLLRKKRLMKDPQQSCKS
jgi:hypothetical protein